MEKTGRGNPGEGEPVARGLAFLFLSQGIFLVCGYAIHIILAHRLGPLDYGVFGFIIAVLSWVEILVYGSSNLAVRYIQSRPDKFSTWKTLFLRAQFWITAAFFIPLAGIAVAVGLVSEKYGFLYLVAFLDLLFIGFYQLYSGYLNGLRLYARQAATSVAYSVSKACAMVILVYLGWRIKGALLGNIISSLVGLLVGYLLLRFRSAGISRDSHLSREEKQLEIPIIRIVKESFVFALVPLLVNFVLNLDLWMVNFLRGGLEVGYYVSAGTLSRIIFFLFSATFMAAFPAIVSSFRKGATSERTRRLFSLSGDFFLAVALPFTLAISVNGGQIVNLLYGESYQPAGIPTSMLSLAMFFLTFFVFLIYVLYAAGEYGKAVRILVSVAFLDLVAAPVMVTEGGMRGAALATTVVSLAGFILAYLSANRSLGLSWNWRRLGIMTLFCCLCFLPLLPIPREGIVFVPLSLVALLVNNLILLKSAIIEKEKVKAALKVLIPGKRRFFYNR